MVRACHMYVPTCMGVHLCAALSRFCHRHDMSFLPGHGEMVAKTQWHQAKVMNLSMAGGVDAHRVMWDCYLTVTLKMAKMAISRVMAFVTISTKKSGVLSCA